VEAVPFFSHKCEPLQAIKKKEKNEGKVKKMKEKG
jgi:hypothetical protein